MSRGNNAPWAPLSWWIRALYKSTYYYYYYYYYYLLQTNIREVGNLSLINLNYKVFQLNTPIWVLCIQHYSKFSSLYRSNWLRNLQYQMGTQFVKSVVEGCRWILAKPKAQKESITSAVLAKLVADKGGFLIWHQASFHFQAFVYNSCLVSFAGMLRSDEILSLRVCDISFYHDHMAVTCQKEKKNQFRQGCTVFMARTGNDMCPVALTEPC